MFWENINNTSPARRGGKGKSMIEKLNQILQGLLRNPIIEETTVESWIVRKYANGKAEAIFTYTPTLGAVSTAKGSLYVGANATRALPAGVFNHIYRVDAKLAHAGTGVAEIGIRSYDTESIDWYVWASTAWQSGQQIVAQFKVEGTWK